MEEELVKFSKERPIELILPSLYSELEGPALNNIVNVLSKNKFLSYVTVGLDKANKSQFKEAKKFFKKLNLPHSIIWNDGPRMKALDTLLKKEGLAPEHPGKGKKCMVLHGVCLIKRKSKIYCSS